MCKGGGVWGHSRGGGLRKIKHLPQSPFTGPFFWITTFGIGFYESNLSTLRGLVVSSLPYVPEAGTPPAAALGPAGGGKAATGRHSTKIHEQY